MKKLANIKSREELLADLAKENFSRKTVSFYRYVKIENPKEMRDFLFENFEKLKCLGRIYVAKEGINAQLNVPEHNWDAFDKFIQGIPEFSGVPYKVALEEKGTSSFIKLIVKVRHKIVADGLDDSSFDPSNTGDYATAEEVNEMIDRGVTVVDMRNFYEAEIGRFENAKVMEVDTFREQLGRVEEDFKDDKEKEVLLYCTGGIRCEKASAWMKHKGFKNVKHIKGGVIDYVHQVKDKGLQNKFKGKNFVFDERLGEKAGDEIISYCHLCGLNKSDNHRHCKNKNCHVLHLSCEECFRKLDGYCSRFCAVCDKLPVKMNRFLVRRDRRQQHKNQYRKNYLKGKIEQL